MEPTTASHSSDRLHHLDHGLLAAVRDVLRLPVPLATSGFVSQLVFTRGDDPELEQLTLMLVGDTTAEAELLRFGLRIAERAPRRDQWHTHRLGTGE
eukprot:COSAG02_NODE_3760_length_6272_cov_13.055565_4_plen_97_part_00